MFQGFTFGFLTTLELTWLVKVKRGTKTIQISNGFPRRGQDPSVAEALDWLLEQASFIGLLT